MSYDKELELQFSPSRWSKKNSAEEVVEKHIEVVTKASNEAKTTIPCQLDIPYGELERQKMDVYGTDLPEDAPIFIYIHGGYWQQLSRDISSYVVKPLYKQKLKVIVLDYTLCPQTTVPEIIEEIKLGLLKCLEIAKHNDSRGLYISGHSAGAHLIACLLETCLSSLLKKEQELIKGLFLISGIYDILPITRTHINDAAKLDEVTAAQVSPLLQNIPKAKGLLNMRIVLIVAEHDSPKFHEQSILFERKLNDLGYKSEFLVIQSVDHFEVVERLNEEDYEITRLILANACSENNC